MPIPPEAFADAETPERILNAVDFADAERGWIAGEFGTNGHDEGLPVGSPAPTFELPTPSGGRLRLADLRGEDVLVLFWSPGCGFCQAIRDDILAWEVERPAGAPTLVVVSSGSAVETSADGFRSRVALDETFEVARSFGATGTPTAVLVDRQGRIASPLAVGTETVLALVGGPASARA